MIEKNIMTNNGWFFSSMLIGVLMTPFSSAQTIEATSTSTELVVISATRTTQSRFDATAAIDVVIVDPFHATSPLVNLSELMGSVPGLQVRNRENYAQDLQVSVRGFGTRASFGVRGVRILVDGIPATMPDGQGQAATASLTSASRIEVLRGPMAQLYGNAAGGVVQIFTRQPPINGAQPSGTVSIAAGTDGQRQLSASLAGGTELLGGVLDISRYTTDGYRDHSAAERNQLAAKVVLRPSDATSVTALLNVFDQPKAEDPLGLTRLDFNNRPRQVIPAATVFDTRKKIAQKQLGVVLDHQFSDNDVFNIRLVDGTRQVMQTLALSGVAASSSGGVIDLDREYGGVGLHWLHKTRVNDMPMSWTVGMEQDFLHEQRRGFVNKAGVPGDLRRDEMDTAKNIDFFAQLDWRVLPEWRVTAGMRTSRVKLGVNDHYVNVASPDDSGSIDYRKTSPVIGVVWSVSDDINLYANTGRGFETPTLAEAAYRPNGTGPNLALRASTSTQAELGVKIKYQQQSLDVALFNAVSEDEIVPFSTLNGRSIFQNVDAVRRRGAEAAWQGKSDKWTMRTAYTWLDASFRSTFSNAQNATINVGKKLPGAPEHSFFSELQYQISKSFSAGMELRSESKVFVNDINSESAPGYTVMNVRTGYAFKAGASELFLFGRVDNLFDKKYAGSVIVNDGNARYFEAAPGRRLFVGLRSAF